MRLIEKPFFRWSELVERYGESLVEDMRRAKWLYPCLQRNRFSFYEAKLVAEADERIRRGEHPRDRSRRGG